MKTTEERIKEARKFVNNDTAYRKALLNLASAALDSVAWMVDDETGEIKELFEVDYDAGIRVAELLLHEAISYKQ